MTSPVGPPIAGRVLLVEDHPDMVEILMHLLHRLAQPALAVGTIADALRAAAAETFGVVLTDYRLPDGTANDLITRLREKHPIPAILLTAFDPADLTDQVKADFALCLQKPVDGKTLGEALVTVTRSPAPGAGMVPRPG